MQRMAALQDVGIYRDIRPDGLSTLRDSAVSWCNSLRKLDTRERLTKVRQLTQEDFINPDDISKFVKQTSSRVKVFDTITSDTIITRDMHTQMRNYLLFSIGLSNAQRSSCLINMTLEELKFGKKM